MLVATLDIGTSPIDTFISTKHFRLVLQEHQSKISLDRIIENEIMKILTTQSSSGYIQIRNHGLCETRSEFAGRIQMKPSKSSIVRDPLWGQWKSFFGAVSHFVRRKTYDKLDAAVCTCPSHVSNIFETWDGQVHTATSSLSYVLRLTKWETDPYKHKFDDFQHRLSSERVPHNRRFRERENHRLSGTRSEDKRCLRS